MYKAIGYYIEASLRYYSDGWYTQEVYREELDESPTEEYLERLRGEVEAEYVDDPENQEIWIEYGELAYPAEEPPEGRSWNKLYLAKGVI